MCKCVLDWKKWCLSELEAIQCRTGKNRFPWIACVWAQVVVVVQQLKIKQVMRWMLVIYVSYFVGMCNQNRHKSKNPWAKVSAVTSRSISVKSNQPTFRYGQNWQHLKCLRQYIFYIVCWTYRWTLRHFSPLSSWLEYMYRDKKRRWFMNSLWTTMNRRFDI